MLCRPCLITGQPQALEFGRTDNFRHTNPALSPAEPIEGDERATGAELIEMLGFSEAGISATEANYLNKQLTYKFHVHLQNILCFWLTDTHNNI